MIHLALRTLRFHRGGFVASFVALFLGAAIVMACGGLLETGVRAEAAPQRLATAPIVVTGDQNHPGGKVFQERVRLDEGLAARIQAVPGVARVVPDVSFPVAVVGDQHTLGARTEGHGWVSAQLAPYELGSGTAPARPGEVVLSSELAGSVGARIGGQVELAVHAHTARFTVVGLATGGPAGVFFADQEAARFLGQPGRIDAVGVFPVSGVDTEVLRERIDAAITGQHAVTLTGAERGGAEFPAVMTDSGNLISMSAPLGGLSIMVTVFIVASTLGLSIRQRQREMALLRAIGTTPGQLRRMILGETVVVAVLAAAPACLTGPYLGEWLLGAFTNAGVVPDVITFHIGWIPMVVAAGTALLTGVGAAFIAANRAARTRPTEALAEAALQRRWLSWPRVLFALLCLGGALALAIVTATVVNGRIAGSTATPAAMLWAAGLALLAPGLTRVVVAVVRWPVRAVSGFAGQLALLNAKARMIRLAGAVMPVMLATGLATSLIYLQTTQARAEQIAYAENLVADAVLTSASGGLPLELVDAVGRLPGVAAASAHVPSSGFLELPPEPRSGDEDEPPEEPDAEEVPLQGITADQASRTTAVQVTAGSLAQLRGDTVALTEGMAAEFGHHVGDLVPMWLGDGTKADLRLVATVTGRLGYETALVPADLLVRHTTSGLVPQILVRAKSDVDRAALVATLHTLSTGRPGLQVTDRETLASGQAEQQQNSTVVAYLFLAMIIGYSVIALVNTMVVTTGARRREFALQRLVGSTRGQLLRMMTVEAALVALAGMVLGAVVSVATLVPLSIAALGSPAPAGPLWICLAVVGSASALTLAATLLPTALALRTRPVEASAGRE